MIVHIEDIATRAGTYDQGPTVQPAADLRNGHALLFERDPNRPFVTTPVRGEEWQRQGRRLTGLLWARVADLEPFAGGQRWWKPPVYPIALYCEFPAAGSITISVLSETLLVIQPQRPPRRTTHRIP
ncbi:hypothetical protein ACIBF6_15705 [Streptosporangium amethystogenes]|uniref:hypothetical protein n=1 Tax=Streptosporangium amethystogenes TaxID=2002 RepID=UPI0037BC8A6D